MKTLKYLNLLCMFICLIGLTSCGNWYYCTVSGYGTIPTEKSFYISTKDSLLYEELEYAEFSSMLSQRLTESGYAKSSPDNAALCILFDYYVGEKEMVGTQTFQSTNSFTVANGKVTTQTTGQGNASANTSINGNMIKTNVKTNGNIYQTTNNKQTVNTITTTGTNSVAVYRRNIGCIIKAIDNKTRKDIWMVEVKDNMKESDSFRKIMPWMMASAQPYFGKSGESEVKITKKEGVEQKGLIWPY